MFNYYRGKQNRPLHRGLRYERILKRRASSLLELFCFILGYVGGIGCPQHKNAALKGM